jgi:hypothetical protein
MPSFSHATPTDRHYWSGITGILAVQLAVLLAVAIVALVYVNWSSNAALAEFVGGDTAPMSRPNAAANFSVPIQHAPERPACARKT